MIENSTVDITNACLEWYAQTHEVGNGYISANNAAEILGYTRARVTQLITEVGFHAVKIGNALYLPLDEVKKYNAGKTWEKLTDYEGC